MTTPNRHAVYMQEGGLSSAMLASALFLFCAWYFWSLEGISQSSVYNASCAAFAPSCLIAGIGMAIVSGLLLLQQTWALLVDAVVSGVAALALLAIGAIWTANSDMQGLLLIIFAVMNGTAAKAAWSGWMARRGVAPPDDEGYAMFDSRETAAGNSGPQTGFPAPPPTPVADGPACPVCGKANERTAMFCNSCGQRLRYADKAKGGGA